MKQTSPETQPDRRRFPWRRLAGPLLSLLIHAGIIALLLSAVANAPRPQERGIDIVLRANEDLTLQPEPADPTPTPEQEPPPETAFLEHDLRVLADTPPPGAEMAVETAPLSPLQLRVDLDLGRHAQTLSALTHEYGKRAAQNGLFGSYFSRLDFSGRTYTRIDETLNKEWELESPWPGKLEGDCFSVIWTGRIVPQRSGVYTLYLQSDDGARLWINGKLVLDQFVERERQVDTVELEMLAGLSYHIKYAYCDVFRHAISRLEWSCGGAAVARQLIPKDCLWADGHYTAQMLKWNEARLASGAPSYPNRRTMKNPAQVGGFALSHLVNYDTLNPAELVRLRLPDLVSEFNQHARQGSLPRIVAGSIPADADFPSSPHATGQDDDVRIEIL